MALPRYSPISVDAKELQRLLGVAGQAADAAAAVTTRYFRSEMTVENKADVGSFDPVTIADREAELAIRQVMQEQCPAIGFYGEEYETLDTGNGLVWVVDPIDGTRAFMSGMPLWGTLIGLYNGQEAILGVMDQPILKERFEACNGQSRLVTPQSSAGLSTRQVPEISDAVAYCTTPDMFSEEPMKGSFERIKRQVKLMRYGGDCYAYALLAAGFVDIVLDCDLQPYDIAALIPIVTEAGGVVSSWSGGSAVDGGHVVACGSRSLHQKVLPLLDVLS